MRRPRFRCSVLAGLVVLLVAGLAPRADAAAPIELQDGDRIVLIGDDLIERDQKSGFLETMLTLLNPGKNLTFRNLGWSGDTVFGDARAGFGGRADGFKQLKEHVLALKPTVIFVGYGMSESFDGEPGLASFESGLGRLLDVLSATGARIVLLTPIAHEDLGRPLPDPAEHNRSLRLYSDAIVRTARARGLLSVNLFDATQRLEPAPAGSHGAPSSLTDDGIHLTERGYRRIALAITSDLIETPRPRWLVRVGPEGKADAEGTRLSGVRATPRGVRFEALDAFLPLPLLRPLSALAGTPSPSNRLRILRVEGLAPGRYTLTIDGRPVGSATAQDWAKRELKEGPEFDQVDRLRQVIQEKNRLYFYRWRPQNETYLFGFRKHEQGNNAREIPLFDPLVADKEKEIARLRVPAPHVYELVPESEAVR